MQTQKNFEIEFQELEFKISVKIKIKERKASLFVYYCQVHHHGRVVFYVTSYVRKQ